MFQTGIQQQERVPLERHDVADRGAADDVQVAAVPDDHHVDDRQQQAPGRPQHHLAPMREHLLAQHGVPPAACSRAAPAFRAEAPARRESRRTSRPRGRRSVPRPCGPSGRWAGSRRAKTKLISITPGMMARAVNASRQFSVSSTTTAMIRRMTEMAGDTMAICNRPVVVSTSPVRRDRMPPVFMSHSFGNGRCSSRSKSDRRSDSMTRTFSSRWR